MVYSDTRKRWRGMWSLLPPSVHCHTPLLIRKMALEFFGDFTSLDFYTSKKEKLYFLSFTSSRADKCCGV